VAFDTAIYTDVSREDAADGMDGFNFQSMSPGIDGTDLRCIRESMLHRISTSWPIDRDELEHPPTAVYFRQDDRMYFSRGRSTGRTLSGRRGNQLTQAIVTSLPEDLAPYRPAQIFAAVNWDLTTTTTSAASRWHPPLEIDPSFEADALIQRLRDDEWQMKVLPAFLSMLEQAGGAQPRKVVLVHDDLDTIMRWFALGTLLLDPRDAGRLEFRAFATDPYSTRAPLVGVHPDLQRGQIPGAHVIDIAARTASDIPVSSSAEAVASWIRELDPFDALEVIAIAQRWMPVIGARAGAAGAELVTGTRPAALGRDEWELGNEVIEGLATAGLRDDLVLYVDELSDSVASHRPQGEADFRRAARTARLAARSEVPGLAQAILVPTLESLAQDGSQVTAWARELVVDDDWRWPEGDDGDAVPGLISEIIVNAPDAALRDLLLLAAPMAARLSAGELEPAVRRAAGSVLADPRIARDGIDGWYGAASIRRELRRAIVGSLRTQGTTSPHMAALVDGSWDFLDPDTDALTAESASFGSWLLAARLARLPVQERISAIEADGSRPGQDSWRMVLGEPRLPEDSELLVAWTRACGVDRELRALIQAQLAPVLLLDPRDARKKDFSPWIPLVEAMVQADPRDPAWQDARSELLDLLEAVPSTLERANALFSRKNSQRKD
jgi:hypothetical protein